MAECKDCVDLATAGDALVNDVQTFQIAVLAGDGIGPEVIAQAIRLVEAVAADDGTFRLDFEYLDAGATHYERAGESLPADVMEAARKADAIFLGAMGMPHIRYDDGTEIAPQLELREQLELYAGVRPIRTIAGLPTPLRDARAQMLDIVLVRESTEGLFKSRNRCKQIGDEIARDTLEITRATSERLFRFAFDLAAKRKRCGRPGEVMCVDKANVLGSFAFFRKVFDEISGSYPDLSARHGYVDAVGLWLVKQPWVFDVLVTENMFGDILSDVGAGLMGGMGMAPSADIGDEYAVFQPCHGSAPDIVGQGIANPVAAILSGAMMLDWLGDTYASEACHNAARTLSAAVDAAFVAGELVPVELGGDAGTAAIGNAIAAELDKARAA
ncbi:MAG: isocitrate/isopropylmalate dehydrogenase family protein [Woeseiaceae bacterium]|nr:isocitrate/isopropylmalate dehydrogenase family protein [Woeseiaceae bacterium]